MHLKNETVHNVHSQHTISAIIFFQSLWRKYRVRRNFLPFKMFTAARAFIQNCPDISKVAKALTGVTKVYFPEGIPVALKALGVERSKRRFLSMYEARNICARNGYTCLSIPRACPYGEYNIEEKLPVIDVNQREQIGLYEENKLLFSQAVREFTGFLCQTTLPDILTYSHPYQNGNKFPLGRYDNIPLLVEKGIGKIVLIDLGGLKIREGKISVKDALDTIKTAIYIFPYHAQEIISVGLDFCPALANHTQELHVLSQKVITPFEMIYRNHYEFIMLKISGNKQLPNLESLALLLPTIEQLKKFPLPNVVTLGAVCERTLTISCSEKIQDKVQNRLDELILRQEICFANFYLTRTQQLNIRIHY